LVRTRLSPPALAVEVMAMAYAVTATVTRAVCRRAKGTQLRRVREDIERELGRRTDFDLTPCSRYLDLAHIERQLMDELERLNIGPWA
jgi:hypothetical protein